jgi:NAD(P)-dependent dehydrogenase (short-subunit alcohol dehydrogenase family)
MTDPVGGWSPAYCISKSLLNAIARHLANELSHRKIPVNAFCPGWVKTDMGGKSAPRSIEEGADTAVWLATTEKVGSGNFYRDRKVIPW